jgi:L-ascorbate metabolism protein UlaG (beta-lactamase superfamily)
MAEFRWFGHNCFRIRSREAVILTDPVDKSTGFSLPKQTADIVTVSHDHPGHANLAAVKPDYFTISGPGEYEVHGVFITGVRTYHDTERGAARGYNTVYLIELEGMQICHLGDLGHPLTEEQAEALTNTDVLLIPAGGGSVIDSERAAEVVAQLQPKLVVPMQFKTAKGDKDLAEVAEFCRHLGVEMPAAEEKLTLRSSDLTEQMQAVVLTPEG